MVQAAGEQHVVIAWTDSGKVYYILQDIAEIIIAAEGDKPGFSRE